MDSRTCNECSSPLPDTASSRTKYCSVTCRQRAKNRAFKERHPNYWTEWDRTNAEKRRQQRRDLYAKKPEHFREKTRRQVARRKERDPDFRKRRYRENRETIRAQENARRAADPERARKRQRKWREKNPDRCRELAQLARKRNLERMRESVRRYHKNHPHMKRASEARRRAKKKGITPEEKKLVAHFYEYVANARRLKCRWCGKWTPKNLRHVDHVKPLSKGGRHAASNLCCACSDCNTKKNNKMPGEWAAELDIERLAEATETPQLGLFRPDSLK